MSFVSVFLPCSIMFSKFFYVEETRDCKNAAGRTLGHRDWWVRGQVLEKVNSIHLEVGRWGDPF